MTTPRKGTITASGDKTVVTFEDGERLEFYPPPSIYFAGQAVEVTRYPDGSFTVASALPTILVRP